MRDIALFVEDEAHRQIVGPLATRVAHEHDTAIRLEWRSTVRGHGMVKSELRTYLRDLERQGDPGPDLVIVATDANCTELNERTREIERHIGVGRASIVLAIPDPHIERWLLLDGAAFKAVLGQGCNAPDQKCSRTRYKQRLVEAVRDTGVTPILGGLEYAEDIIQEMNIDRAAQADRSFERFIRDLRGKFREWRE